MITDNTALVTSIDCPYTGAVNEIPMAKSPSGKITAIRADLQTHRVAHVRQLLLPGEVQAVAQLLGQFTNDKAGSEAALQVRDKAGLITELERVCRLNSALTHSQAFTKCQQIATEYFGAPCHYGFDHAIFKEPGSGSVDWHQDQHYSRFDLDKQCLSFWIPLQPANAQNGGMEYATGDYDLLPHTPVSKGSHAHFVAEKHRPTGPTVSPDMQPGDVCIHTPMTLHRSHPHQGDATRAAWILQFNRYGYSRFFRWANFRQHIRKLYMLEPYQPADIARMKID